MQRFTAVLLAAVVPCSQTVWAQTVPSVGQLPTGGQVVAGEAAISQNAATMNIDQFTPRAVIDWQSFDIGSSARVNFNQPTNSSVALNRVLNSDPTQIFGRLTANGQVYLTNAAGVYFAPGASVNVGGLIATTHTISNEDFMDGRINFYRGGAEGSVVNEGSITVDLASYVALLAPEVRNEGVIIAQMGTVAMAAGEMFELQFNHYGNLTDITVTKSDIAALVENKSAIEVPGGLIILSAQAANHLQGGIVKNSGTLEASGMVNDGGTVRLVASDSLDIDGVIHSDAAAGSNGNGGTVFAVADLENRDSLMSFSGTITARGGDTGGDGGFIETSGSHFLLKETAFIDTFSNFGQTGTWLIDPYDYTINGAAATAIVTALSSSNVEVTTASDVSGYGSNGNNASTGNITVSSAINSNSANLLTLTADNAITVSAAIAAGALTLTGPGGITLNNDLTTRTAMTINGNISLGADVTLTSGISNTYTGHTSYTVAAGVTSVTATLVGASGGKGGLDTSTGGDAGTAGVLTASFAVNPGDTFYIAAGSAGVAGGDQKTNTGGSAGGTNFWSLASGGAGGDTGPSGNSGGGAGGGAATILALTDTPTTASAMLVAAGGGGGGGSGNNTACPSLCGDQSSADYRTDNSMNGERGYHAGNGASPSDDGGGSGGGGGGLLGGKANQTVFFVNEWTGRGGNVGSSGAANGFTTTSLSTALTNLGNSQAGYAIISYGGGTIDINGTINGARNLDIVARSSDVSISGAIGGSTALTTLDIIGASGIELLGGVTSTGAQSYSGPLSLNANTTTFTTTNSAITFAGDISKASGVSSNLTVSSGSGNVSFNGQTGTSSSPIGAVSVTTTGTTSFAGALYATSLTKSGAAKTTVSGGTVQTTGSQSYAGILDLGGDVTLRSTGTGNITLSGAVSNNTQSDLTINAAGGNVTLSGNLAVGTNARPTPIGDVSITSSGTTTIGSSGTPISADAKSLTVTANDTNVYADTGTSFTCGTGASATGVCLTTSANFTVSSASTFSGPLAGTTSLTKAGSAKLSMSGNNTYSGNTNVSAGTLEISGSGKLGNGNYAGNISVTGQLRDNSSSNQTYSGTISGSGFINSPGSGTLNISTLSADHYNLGTAYVVPTGSSGGSTTSSIYGNTPTFSYQLATTAGGGTAISDADPSGTPVLNGKPTATSNVGSYTISYASGLSLGSERYTLQAGNNLGWTVNPRPLTVTVSKTYDASAAFTSGFSLSGTVNSDATPTLSGGASVSSINAGNYTSFASSTLTQNNTNYTLTGATINATISQKPLNLSVSKIYDASTVFNSNFQLTGMAGSDAEPTVSGSASVSNSAVGNYTSFASNGLSLSNTNYTLTGGTVTSTISQRPLNITVSKTYDGSTLFTKDFHLSGMAGSDAEPTITGTANVGNSTAGSYSSFVSNTLGQNNTNYKLTGGTVSATITPESPVVPVTTSPTITVPEINTTTPQLTLPQTTEPIITQNTVTGPAVNQPTTETSQSNAVNPPPQNNESPTHTSNTQPAQKSDNTSSNTNSNSISQGDNSTASNTQQKTIVVSLVQEPSAQTSGMITVAVPKDMIARTGGFSFPLPEKISAADISTVNVVKVGGDPLPSWLHFNPETKTFTATSVPSGGLPLQVIVTTGDVQTTIVISEQP